MIYIMFILCKLILAALAVSLVMAVDNGEFVLKPCAGGVFEETYFNFDIYIDNFSEDCEDFEKMSEKIQLMIEKVEKMAGARGAQGVKRIVAIFKRKALKSAYVKLCSLRLPWMQLLRKGQL